jgi:hypothetical protein
MSVKEDEQVSNFTPTYSMAPSLPYTGIFIPPNESIIVSTEATWGACCEQGCELCMCESIADMLEKDMWPVTVFC